MNELLLMKTITGLCVLTVLFIYVLHKFNIRIDLKQYKFTENSFKGFSSFDEFLNYFRFAFNFILKNKFVFLFPFVFVISLNLFSTVLFYLARINYKNSGFDSVFNNESKFNMFNYFNIGTLVNSIRALDYGLYDYLYVVEIGISIIIFLFGLIYYLFYRKTNKLIGIRYEKIIKYYKLYLIFFISNIVMFLFTNFINIQIPHIFTTIQ